MEKEARRVGCPCSERSRHFGDSPAVPNCSFLLSSKEQFERFRLSFFVSSFIPHPHSPPVFASTCLPSKHCNMFSATSSRHLGGRKGKPPVSPRKVVALH